MTQAYVVASAQRLRQLRLLAETPSLRGRRRAAVMTARRQAWQDVAVALGVLALGWAIGAVLS
jgi:hypothetical protein